MQLSEKRSEVVVAVFGLVGLFITVLGFMLAYAAHFNAKLQGIEDRCVQRDTYQHHNHGGNVPPEGQ